jgi:hypothetical protein
VGFNNLDEREAVGLVRAARGGFDTVVSMCLASCKISTAGCKEIGEYIRCSRSLTSLDLQYNHIDAEGGGLLAVGLSAPTALLQTLNLSENFIGAEGFVALAEALQTNATLTYLNASEINRGSDGREDTSGVMAVARALRHNKALARLNLSANDIDSHAERALADALEEANATLTHLDLSGTPPRRQGPRAELVALRKLSGSTASGRLRLDLPASWR